jgi:hypothetical protein
MAKYFLYVKVFSRGKGSRVTRAAAYRAGERIRDERTSEVYNYAVAGDGKAHLNSTLPRPASDIERGSAPAGVATISASWVRPVTFCDRLRCFQTPQRR